MLKTAFGRPRRYCGIALFACLIALLMFPGLMTAQTFLGSVVGTITDTTGASVPGAKVTLTNTGTNEEHGTSTASSGDYQFLNLIPGAYRMAIEKEGFSRLVRENITVAVQGEVRVDGSLNVGAASQTVEVSSEVAQLDTETASVSAVVDSATVDGLSLNGRNVMNLIALSNAVVPNASAMGSVNGNTNGGSSTNFGQIGAYTIGGGMSNQSSTLLDGAPVNINQYNATSLVPTQDAVQEFRVVTNNVDAQFGRFAGGVVNLTTKSGTNSIHGGASEFLRNRIFNGNTFFNNLAGLHRPKWTQNQYVGNVGGPVKKDKLFFFASYEGFKLGVENPNVLGVPTPGQRNGDFTAAGNSGLTIPAIYDPATVCGVPGNNSACPVSNGTVQYLRTQFPNNIIPASRIDKYAQYIQNGWNLPNGPGLINNYSVNQPANGTQYQLNGRGDYSLSDRQRLYTRYTYWNVDQAASHPFSQPARPDDVGSEFKFQTHQTVLGDTYLLSPSLVLGTRASFLRNTNCSVPGDAKSWVDLSNWGPGYVALLNSGQLDGPVAPGTGITNVSQGLDGFAVQCGRNNLYSISADLTRTLGRHTLKFGGESRDAQVNKFQANPAGSFNYTNAFTAQNALNTGSTGYAYASFLLGIPNSGSLKTSQVTANTEYYSGIYVMDTFQVNRKLTLTGGLRWDLPTSFTERYDRIGVFQPGVPNPAAQATGLPLMGAVGYVNTQSDPYRSVYAPHYKLFAPRAGLAYRFSSSMVARLGYAIAYTPNDNNLPNTNTVNSATTTYVASLNGGVTPANIASNPFPSGVIASPGRNASSVQALTLGQTITLPMETIRYPYAQQWNVTLGRDFHHGVVVEASYAGLKGTFLPLGGNTQLNQLPDQYDSMGQALLNPVKNPFAGLVTIGSLANATVNAGQLLRPFPQYQTVGVEALNDGNSTYNSLQTHFQKNFSRGNMIMLNYTWSKELGDAGGLPIPGFASPAGNNSIQDWNNLRGSKALDPSNVAHRAVVAYVYELPFGKGRALMSNAGGFVNAIVSGWGLNGVVTIQSGQPLSVGYNGSNVLSSFGAGGIRPNQVAGCDKTLPGSTMDRYNSGKFFNTACFTAPATNAFGDEPAVDNTLRGQGITNIDLAASRRFKIGERIGVQFRAESFNLANHVRFANPGTTLGSNTFGLFVAGGTGQANTPRLIQMALRVTF
jgi:hypothetical protein